MDKFNNFRLSWLQDFCFSFTYLIKSRVTNMSLKENMLKPIDNFVILTTSYSQLLKLFNKYNILIQDFFNLLFIIFCSLSNISYFFFISSVTLSSSKFAKISSKSKHLPNVVIRLGVGFSVSLLKSCFPRCLQRLVR